MAENRTIGIEVDRDWEADDAMRADARLRNPAGQKLMAQVKALAARRLQRWLPLPGGLQEAIPTDPA